MFKALLLSGIASDAELEFRLGDSLAFGRFMGLSLEDEVPTTTLCRFRNQLVSARLLEKLFSELDRQLESAGLVLKEGTCWTPP
ncbi:MAG: transposase [Caulobacteraceae bacterium]